MAENKKADASNTGSDNQTSNDETTSTNSTPANAQEQCPVQQLDDFLAALFPSENEPIHLRSIPAKNYATKQTTWQRTVTRNALQNDKTLLSEIAAVNQTRGVCFAVNSGGGKDGDIKRFNAFFAENDRLSISDQHKRLDTAPVQPSIRVETKKSVHAYWLIDGDCTEQEWKEVQGLLIDRFDGDKSITNPSRIMRLPGYNHVSYNRNDANPGSFSFKPVQITHLETGRRFSLKDMRTAFPKSPNATAKHSKSDAELVNSVFLSDKEIATPESQELAKRCLQYFTQKRCDERPDWLAVGFAFRNVFNGDTNGLELWRDWSKKSAAYEEGCCEKIWYGDERETGEKLTVGSLVFWAKQDSQEFARIWEEQHNSPGTSKTPKEASRLLGAVVNSIELFHTADGESFASVQNNGHRETHKLDSKAFKTWLSYAFYKQEGKSPNAQAVTDVIQTLTGNALFDSPQQNVFLRVAEKGNAVYVDLCDEYWRVVEITKDGWRILDKAPVKFRRTKGMLALPEPTRGGELILIKDYINVCADDFVLVLAWLVACFCFNKPYPVLILYGEQGSAKSTTSRVLRRLVDPNKADLREKPKDARDLIIAANNGYIVAYDNLSSLSAELSDTLCRLATGGGFSTRELYSNDEETIFDVKRPLMLNGIEESATRSDLLDRALLVECPRITEQSRKTETAFESAFAAEHSKLLGALFDAVSTAMRELPNVRLTNLPRMADFARWACAAESAFGLPGNSFFTRYRQNRETAHAATLDSSPVGKAILNFMQIKPTWRGSANELLGLLFCDSSTKAPGIPKTAKAMSGALKRLAPSLRANGIEYESKRTSNVREITLTRQM